MNAQASPILEATIEETRTIYVAMRGVPAAQRITVLSCLLAEACYDNVPRGNDRRVAADMLMGHAMRTAFEHLSNLDGKSSLS